MLKNIHLAVPVLAAFICASYLYFGRVQTFDPKLQKEIETKIPECAERDKAGEAMGRRMKEQNRSYYYADELDDYERKAKECFSKFVKAIQAR
jgi:hypothetical protein